jgi:hypothetical protein
MRKTHLHKGIEAGAASPLGHQLRKLVSLVLQLAEVLRATKRKSISTKRSSTKPEIEFLNDIFSQGF